MKSLDSTRKTISIVMGVVLLFWVQNVIAGATLSGMRIGQTTDKTRIVFDLKQTQRYQVSQLANPARLVVDFYDTANYLSFKNKHITDSRLFKIRVSDNKKRVRVVLDLHKTPQYKAFLLNKNAKGKERLVVDLMDKTVNSKVTPQKVSKPNKQLIAKKQTPVKATVKTQQKVLAQKSVPASNVKAVTKAKTETKKVVVSKTVKNDKPVQVAKVKKHTAHKELKQTVKTAKPLINRAEPKKPLVKLSANKTAKHTKNSATESLLNKDSSIFSEPTEFVIAIDAGHGGKDPGAVGYNGVYEKDVALMISKELKRLIDRQPGMKAVMTRDKDVFIPLSKRVSIAKRKKADLFISVHADAFYDKTIRGGSVYILSERGASSTMAKLLARSENAALQDIKLDGRDDDVAFVLSDLSREANIKASRQLAKTVLGEMHKKVKMHKHTVQSAGFAVLKSIDMPSLLVETAFISNPHEARKLMNPKFQHRMASAIVDGLRKYVDQTVQKERWGETLYVHHKVQRGDTLSQIAETYQVSTLTLKKINKIKNANSLYVGKKLKIPVSEKYVAGL